MSVQRLPVTAVGSNHTIPGGVHRSLACEAGATYSDIKIGYCGAVQELDDVVERYELLAFRHSQYNPKSYTKLES
jgi:hypothetical protein